MVSSISVQLIDSNYYMYLYSSPSSFRSPDYGMVLLVHWACPHLVISGNAL